MVGKNDGDDQTPLQRYLAKKRQADGPEIKKDVKADVAEVVETPPPPPPVIAEPVVVEITADKRPGKPPLFMTRRLGAHLIDACAVQAIAWPLLWSMKSDLSLLLMVFGSPQHVVVSFLYYGFFLSRKGATPGKMLFRLRLRLNDGRNVGWFRAFFRETIGKFISWAPLGLGHAAGIFRKDGRTLHDIIFDTEVVSSAKGESGP